LAEILAYCSEYEAAEKTYLEMDRKDLAIDLRVRLGDWFKVVQLIKLGGGGDDVLLEKAWNQIGDYYYDRQRWAQAITYYSQGRNVDRLVEVYHILEDYDSIEKIASGLSENHPKLKDIADKFVSVGMCQPAVNAYMKLGDVNSAINACITMNQWSTAIKLAETYNFKEIEEFLTRYAKHILSQNRKKEAVELFRKANYCQKSAKLLYEVDICD
jgi:WD repeat-containing protein 35